MRGSRSVWSLASVGLLGLITLTFLSEPGARVIARLFTSGPPAPPTLARVVDLSGGTLSLIRGPRVEQITRVGDRPVDLVDGDRVETDGTARATLALNSQDELQLLPRAAVSLELWDQRNPNSPIYLHVLAGDLEPKRAGVRGRAYVVRAGRLYLPSQRPGEKQPALLISRGATAPDLTLGGAPARATTDDVADAPAPEERSARDDDPETLANEYVEEIIASRQTQFQKCWLSRLKDKPELKGTLTVQFEISRRGKVHETRVTGASLNDDQLAACVATVVERLPFRSFRGPEISISYPITFE